MRKGPGSFARFEEHDALFPEESSSCSEPNSELIVSSKGAVGSISFVRNGIFQYKPKKQGRSMFGTGAKEIKILHQQLVGLVRKSMSSFEVWYCPLLSNKPGETKRKLLKSPEFAVLPGTLCEFGAIPEEIVERFINHVRQACCWDSRSMAPRLAIVIPPQAETSRSVLQLQKTLLPILQGAAGMKVEVLDAVEPQNVPYVLDFAKTDMLIVLGSDGISDVDVEVLSQHDIPVRFVSMGSGCGVQGSPKSTWCPIITAHAICKGIVLDDPSYTTAGIQDPSPRSSRFFTAASSILNSIKDNKPDMQWKSEPGFVCGVFRDLVASGKDIRGRCGYLQEQMTATKAMAASQQQDCLLGSGQNVGKKGLRKQREDSSNTTSSAGWGQHERRVLLNDWSSLDCNSCHKYRDTVPAYRPLVGASWQLSS